MAGVVNGIKSAVSSIGSGISQMFSFEGIASAFKKMASFFEGLGKLDAKPAANTQAKAEDAKKNEAVKLPSRPIVVKSGDTIGSIARDAKVSVDDLKSANPDIFKDGRDAAGRARKASGGLIYPGDVIKVAAAPTSVPPEAVNKS
jgi:LysM repeat protein